MHVVHSVVIHEDIAHASSSLSGFHVLCWQSLGILTTTCAAWRQQSFLLRVFVCMQAYRPCPALTQAGMSYTRWEDSCGCSGKQLNSSDSGSELGWHSNLCAALSAGKGKSQMRCSLGGRSRRGRSKSGAVGLLQMIYYILASFISACSGRCVCGERIGLKRTQRVRFTIVQQQFWGTVNIFQMTKTGRHLQISTNHYGLLLWIR